MGLPDTILLARFATDHATGEQTNTLASSSCSINHRVNRSAATRSIVAKDRGHGCRVSAHQADPLRIAFHSAAELVGFVPMCRRGSCAQASAGDDPCDAGE